jgi:hypothetical protein
MGTGAHVLYANDDAKRHELDTQSMNTSLMQYVMSCEDLGALCTDNRNCAHDHHHQSVNQQFRSNSRLKTRFM